MVKTAKNTDINSYQQIKEYLIDSFFDHICKNTAFKNDKLILLHKTTIANKYFDLVSIVMSYLAVNNYIKGARYYQTINLLNDAKYIANSCASATAQKINLFCAGLIEYWEKNIEISLNLIKGSLLIKTNESKDFSEEILAFKQKIENENRIFSNNSTPSFIPDEIKDNALLALLQVGRSIAIETNIDSLLAIIARQIEQALCADRCTVFLLDSEHNELWSKVAPGLESEEIRFSATKGLAGHVALSGETVNIKNAYENEYFNKDIDIKTGYKTRNILCMPIRNLSHQIVGVFQVLNKFDGDFTQKDEDLLLAIGSSAGIALENANLFDKQKKLIEEQRNLFTSFINALSASIDARDKITSGHSKRVMLYAALICDKCNLKEKEKEIIKNAALLHDIGKIGIKDSILQKEGKLTPDEYEHIKEHVKLTDNILGKVYISKNFKEVASIASSHHEKYDGSGYFKGLKGEEIPLGGRILSVCDVFDAVTSKRHYRDKMEIKDALEIIVEGENKHFDKNITDAFLDISTYDILNVILGDGENIIEKTEQNILKEFNLSQLYAIVNNNVITGKEKKLIRTFNKYYRYNS